jgi:hypothetical protein
VGSIVEVETRLVVNHDKILLWYCRQIYQEIANLPYLLNIFSFDSGSDCEKFAGRLSRAQFKHIRKIQVQLTGYDNALCFRLNALRDRLLLLWNARNNNLLC